MKKSILFTLLCGTFLSSAPVLAEEISTIPTIDRLSAEAKEFLESYTPTEHELYLDITDKKNYLIFQDAFFLPNEGEDIEALQILALIGNTACTESKIPGTGVFYLGGSYYDYYPELFGLPQSGYTLTPIDITKDEATGRTDVITAYSKNENNTLTEKYYQITLEAHKDFITKGFDVGIGTIINQQGNKTLDEFTNATDIVGDWFYNKGSVFIFSNTGRVNIIGDFISNDVGIYNNGTIGAIVGNYINNGASAISNEKSYKIYSISGNFINNGIAKINSKQTRAVLRLNRYSGAISNEGSVGKIYKSNFIQNSGHIAGAIYNAGSIENIVNSNFYNNSAVAATNTGKKANAGAIDSYDTLNIHAEDGNSEFVGNTVTNDDVIQNIAINMETADTALNLSAQNGHILFEDAIVGNSYDINITPQTATSISASASSFDEPKDDLAWVKADKLADPATYVRFNNEVSGVNNLSLADGTVMWLGTNGKINSSKMNSLGLSTLTVDVGVKDNALTAGLIETGYLSGQYQVFVNAPDTQNLEGELAQKSVVFLRAEEADENASFKVARVMKSPYLWRGQSNVFGADDKGVEWSLEMGEKAPAEDTSEEDKPQQNQPDNKDFAPEIIAAAGLHNAAFEQTRSLAQNVSQNLANEQKYCSDCGAAAHEKLTAKRRSWAHTVGERATLKNPVKTKADIWGLDAGFDLARDYNNRLGLFASYRKGDYDLTGEGKHFSSSVGSKINLNSYLGGLYYRYDKADSWAFATLYGGVQKAEIKAGDRAVNLKTDGSELGAALEVGHTFAYQNDLRFAPTLNFNYTQVNFDGASDAAQKNYSWKTAQRLEAEAGVKVEKDIEKSRLYIKPSVVRTFNFGDEMSVTNLKTLSTTKDQTLGRIELGADFNFTDSLSAYTWLNYTANADYHATAGGLGLTYRW